MQNSNRRSFLKNGAMLGAALFASSASVVVAAGCNGAVSHENNKVPQKLKLLANATPAYRHSKLTSS